MKVVDHHTRLLWMIEKKQTNIYLWKFLVNHPFVVSVSDIKTKTAFCVYLRRGVSPHGRSKLNTHTVESTPKDVANFIRGLRICFCHACREEHVREILDYDMLPPLARAFQEHYTKAVMEEYA